MKDNISNIIHQADYLLSALNELERQDPLEFSKYSSFRNILRLFIELALIDGFESDKIGKYSSITSEIVAPIVLGKGKLDFRLLLEDVFENHAKISMTKVSDLAGVSRSIASNYRNNKRGMNIETYEKLINQML